MHEMSEKPTEKEVIILQREDGTESLAQVSFPECEVLLHYIGDSTGWNWPYGKGTWRYLSEKEDTLNARIKELETQAWKQEAESTKASVGYVKTIDELEESVKFLRDQLSQPQANHPF